jgi:hypothetical protein
MTLADFLLDIVEYAEAHPDDPNSAPFLAAVAELRAAVESLSADDIAELRRLTDGDT